MRILKILLVLGLLAAGAAGGALFLAKLILAGKIAAAILSGIAGFVFILNQSGAIGR